ncbi:MAG: phosphoribosyltransferase [Desulfurococcaceae archaeon]
MFRVKRGRVLVVRRPSENDIRAFAEKLRKVHSKSKADKMRMRLMACEVLRLLKPNLSYRDLYELTGIPESMLCRYVRGSVIPSFEQASHILARIALSINISDILRDIVEREKTPIIDLLRVLKDPYIIRLLSVIILLELADKEITRIIAVTESVLPLATVLALEFNASTILMKRKSYPGIQYYSGTLMRSPKDVETLYLDKDLIGRRDKVLVLTDIVYTGRTLESALQVISKSRAEIVDIIAVMGLGTLWKDRLLDYNVKVLAVIPFEI